MEQGKLYLSKKKEREIRKPEMARRISKDRYSGGSTRSSEESFVMRLERRC